MVTMNHETRVARIKDLIDYYDDWYNITELKDMSIHDMDVAGINHTRLYQLSEQMKDTLKEMLETEYLFQGYVENKIGYRKHR